MDWINNFLLPAIPIRCNEGVKTFVS